MVRLKQFISRYRYVLLVLLLIIPAFWVGLKPGIWSMHDFHTFRQFEYDKCLADWQLPCRWTPDATFEYGQPTFNFYAQLVYAQGEILRLFGLSVIDTIKWLFILSLVFSALSMYLLAKKVWKDQLAAVVAAVFYIYAPYRAVDVYVRGALPEAWGFVWFPLILYWFEDYLETKRWRSWWLMGLCLAALIVTHNLSTLMFAVVVGWWMLYRIYLFNAWKLVPKLLAVALVAFGLSSFYLLPVIFESKLVAVANTAAGFYDYNNHFATIRQLLIQRMWGYGGSGWWDNDGLSFSVGHLHWVLPILGIIWLVRERRVRLKSTLTLVVLLSLGWLGLWLTHNKSVLVWQLLPGLKFIQFPWRFLGVSVFCFSLVIGGMVMVIRAPKWRIGIASLGVLAVIGVNISFFTSDQWLTYSDKELFEGENWVRQTSSSAGDYWPAVAEKIPEKTAPKAPIFKDGDAAGTGREIIKRSDQAVYEVKVGTTSAEVSFPIVSFAGWSGKVNGQYQEFYPSGEFGLLTTRLTQGEYLVQMEFKNTFIRTFGNWVSLTSLVIWLVGWLYSSGYLQRLKFSIRSK